MKKCAFVASLFLLSFSSVSFAQEEITDEFEIQGPGVEINSSKESIRQSDEIKDVPESSPFEMGNPRTTEAPTSDSFDLSTAPQEAAADEASQNAEATQDADTDTVLVRTREEDSAVVANPSGLVEVRMPVDSFLPYKQRQKDWGFLVSLGAEQAKFPNLVTPFATNDTDNFSFEEMLGSDSAALFSLELGPKYNTKAGSFALLFGYGSFDTKSKAKERLTKTRIEYTRYETSVVYYLDTFFDEAYFIPYAGAGIWQGYYKESPDFYPGESEKYSTDIGTQYRVGALFGLDWIEGDAARVSRRQNSTQGTFLNFYAISTMMSESNPQVNLENEFDIGATIVMEF